jgi:DNA repair exonuclease SbcCD nuclease subunit
VKILFSADIHIKLGQKNVPVEWAKNRYRLLFEQYKLAQPLVDVNILGGDIFDRLPNMEELELYFELLASFSKYTLIYSGNHEALKKNTTFLTHLKNVTRKINLKAEIVDDYFSFQNIDIIPYNKLKEYHPSDIDFHGNILCTHVRGNIPPHVKAEVPLEIFDRWDVVLAGDKGKDKGAIIWICEHNGQTFNVLPKSMTYEVRYKLFRFLSKDGNFDRYLLGQQLTVEFDEYSKKTGFPLRAKAETFRTYEDSGSDPMREVMRLAMAG